MLKFLIKNKIAAMFITLTLIAISILIITNVYNDETQVTQVSVNKQFDSIKKIYKTDKAKEFYVSDNYIITLKDDGYTIYDITDNKLNKMTESEFLKSHSLKPGDTIRDHIIKHKDIVRIGVGKGVK